MPSLKSLNVSVSLS